MPFVLLIGAAVLLAVGVPVFVAILAPTLLTFDLFGPGLPAFTLVQKMVQGINKFSLLAVPLFIYAASIISNGQIGKRLVALVESCLGHLTGGVAIATIVSCGLFGALSGIGQAAIVSIGPIVYPLLIRQGYSPGFSVGLLLCASTLSMLIPPGIAMILYSLQSMSSVGDVFLAGLAAGLIFILVMSLYAYGYARFKGLRGAKRQSWGQRLEALRRSGWALGLPLIIFGGIYSGVFTPTEAAASACVYAIFVECVVYRNLDLKSLLKVSTGSAGIIAGIMILLTAGAALSYYLTLENIPGLVADLLAGRSPFEVMLYLNLVFLVTGMFIDPNSTVIVLTPIVYPAAMQLGMDPVHLGAVVTMTIAIGMITPPFGINIFVGMVTFNVSYMEVVKSALPFILLALVTLLIINLSPGLILWLPAHLG